MTTPLPWRIFIATPGDLVDERALVRRTIDEWNSRQTEMEIEYEVVGWESVRGTARRPQDEINDLISECHFLIALFKGKWGSEPGGSWGYTSGTEEELFTGLLELGQPEQPMRDIWVGFFESESSDSNITNLKAQLVDQHLMMFEALKGGLDLKQKLTERLDGWSDKTGKKTARHVELTSSSGSEMLKAAKLRLNGEKLIDLGQIDAGMASLKEAAAIGGPAEDLNYAKFLARTGDLDSAFKYTEFAIRKTTTGFSLHSPLAAEAFAAQAGIYRRRGDHRKAVAQLEQALTLLGEDDLRSLEVRCRILDEIGLSEVKLKNVEVARGRFAEALAVRRDGASARDIAQSLVNLARLAVAEDELGAAWSHCDEGMNILAGSPSSSLHANLEVLASQIKLRQNLPEKALQHALNSRILNQQFGNTNGEAISLLLIAQCHRALRQFNLAVEAGKECLVINEENGNAYGAEQAQWQIDEARNQVSK